MKLVPLLIVTNALALGGCIWLFLEQQDLSDRLASARNTTSSRAGATDPALLARLDSLEADLSQRLARERALEEAFSPGTLPADAPSGAAEGGEADGEPLAGLLAGLEGDERTGDDAQAPLALGSTPKMDEFRRLVRRANDLNEEEDRVREVLRRLDGLIGENRIGPIDEEKKVAVARTVLGVRSSMRDRMRQAFENTDVRTMEPEQRRDLFRREYEAVQTETQRKLEEFLPAPDAKLVADSTLRGGDMWGRGPGAGGGGGRPPAGGGNRGR